MHVASLTVEARLPQAQSLKDKRAIVTPILEGARRRFAVAVAEVEDQDRWHQASLGFAVVSPSVSQATLVLDRVERFVWSFPEVEVGRCERHWLDTESDW